MHIDSTIRFTRRLDKRPEAHEEKGREAGHLCCRTVYAIHLPSSAEWYHASVAVSVSSICPPMIIKHLLGGDCLLPNKCSEVLINRYKERLESAMQEDGMRCRRIIPHGSREKGSVHATIIGGRQALKDTEMIVFL